MNDISQRISQKILFVDDEALLLEGIKRQLRRDVDLTTAEGAAVALQILAEQGPFAVVVSDYNMPGMDGIAFLNNVYQLYPQTVLIMLTGRAEMDLVINALHNAHIARFLNKPCPKEILLETLTDGLEQYRLRMSEQLLQAQIQQANSELHKLNTQLESLVEQKTRALQLQYRHVANMAHITSSQAIVDALVKAVVDLTGLEQIGLWLSPQLNGQYCQHYPVATATPDCFNAVDSSQGIVAEVLRSGQMWQYHSHQSQSFADVDASVFQGDKQPMLCMPLDSKKGLIGLLSVAGDPTDINPDVVAALIGIIDVSATALQSHWHKEAFEDAQDAIITALAKLSEYRDPETGAHLLRLKKYCSLVCTALAQLSDYQNTITQEFTEDLVRSSPLHDIGKVGIPDAILKKPGRLTPEEFEIMKDHAAIGGDTLRTVYERYPSQSFIKCGMDIAYGHHEKWNGSGYPLGLQGEAIPLSARILALVDVYDALTCRRIYKPPFPREKAMAIIQEGSGTHFDPKLVDIFLAIEEDFHQIAEQYADIV